MLNLLFPGRHHILTNFQMEQMTLVTRGNLKAMPDVNGRPLGLEDRVDNIIWAVTSANHSNTRRNPLPAYRRALAIEIFASSLDAESYIYLIDDLRNTERFAEYVLKKIEVESSGRFRLTPENTIVGCSTQSVIEMYERLGFKIIPFELKDRTTGDFKAKTPWELTQAIVNAGKVGWKTDETFLTEAHTATINIFLKYRLGDVIVETHSDPWLGDDGDITDTRDYNTYVRAFDNGAERKYNLIKNIVKPGKIVDIGCCTGALIRELTLDDTFRESDFYGIEVARKLYDECIKRKEEGYFANDNVFFYFRNIARGPIFPNDSVNTFTTFSLTHEIESYQGRKTLEHFMELLHQQLAFGGRWINFDVVCPENKDEIIYMKLSRGDGRNEDYEKEFGEDTQALSTYLRGLSTYARFLRFAKDFRHDEEESFQYTIETVDGVEYVVLKMGDACEFMSKKEYVDNWKSEMHERFCFFNFDEWKQTAEKTGFKVSKHSYTFKNDWIVDNVYIGKGEEPKVMLYKNNDGNLEKMDYPVTNIVLVCEK